MPLPVMGPRDPHEVHRASTPLETLFDLIFVVAVSFAAHGLRHAESAGHLGAGIVAYLMVFFAIWWAWMNFTWFATSYDTDDALYRVTTLAQMGGALVVAAGVKAAVHDGHQDFTLVVIGYVIMRVAMVSQWLRAAAGDPTHRTTARRYAIGITLVQLLWVAFLAVPPALRLGYFLVCAVLELLVPPWAERANPTPWHRHHITERYGLFTIIVLGESVLASTDAVIEASESAAHLTPLLIIAALTLVIVACMWWLYFSLPQHGLLRSLPVAIGWGYSHYVIFAAAAAVSAGVGVALDADAGHALIGARAAAATLSLPVALFVLFVWLIIVRPQIEPRLHLVLPFGAALIALGALTPFSLELTAITLVGLVVWLNARCRVAAHPTATA